MIFLGVPNKYGYQLDLKDPLVQKLYWRYKDKHHIPHWCPLSDDERLDFEAQVIEWWERRQREQQEKRKRRRPFPGPEA